MNYSETLNLPKTEFPMKANLSQNELRILKKWKELYKKIKKTEKEEVFILHDGPPYANGRIHIGHALNKILKDIVNKYNLMTGKDIVFIPGWDCHGLPIERQVEKELSTKKVKKEQIPKTEFRKLCREYARRFVDIQKEEFIRLGVLADWENPYLTMDPSYEAQEIRELSRFFERGLVYRSKKPVYWCIHDKTAEAEAEVEYLQRKDPSVYVKFPLKKDKEVSLVIWTTTPWTLPANLGIMVGEDYPYVYVKTPAGILILAEALVGNFEKTTGIRGEVIKRVKGKDLIGIEYLHPFVEKAELKGFLSEKTLKNMWKVYPSEFVELETGTGLVHMAPGHGQEDYVIGSKYGIEPYSPVDESGRFKEPAPAFLIGKRVFDANGTIVEILEEKGYLIHYSEIEHSYPHCWRCKNPVIYRATHQWFISMNTFIKGKSLRERALEEIEKVNWIPSHGKERIKSMVANRPDWCISRQRYWGVPITVFYCKGCGSILSDKELFEHIARIVEEYPMGTDIWFEKEESDLIPKDYRCKKCGSRNFRKEEDILDVWFDSGCSHAAVLKPIGYRKADMYLEGSDQHRGWFQASLLESVGSYGEAPYREVLTHGFTVDEKGRKMSKSLGNVVSPQEVVSRYGADILRIWVVSEDYTEDIKLGEAILRNLIEDYRKIRNTLRFMLSNLYDFNPSQEKVPYRELHHFDRWIISRVQSLLEEAHQHYRNYTFHRAYYSIRNFCATTLSALYFDILKDRLYVYSPHSWERKSAQTALYEILVSLTTLIAPFLSFTAEEVWEHIRKIDPFMPESVFLYEIPKPRRDLIDKELEKDYAELLEVRDSVMDLLEIARREKLIKHPYEARVYLYTEDSKLKELLQRYLDYLNFFLTVSQVIIDKGGDIKEEKESMILGVSKAKGRKCPRCWIFYPEEEFNGEVCIRCAKVLKELGYIRI